MDDLLKAIKNSLWLDTDAHDDWLTDLIDQAVKQLEESGVKVGGEAVTTVTAANDGKLRSAITAYVKSRWPGDAAEVARYQAIWEQERDELRTCDGYTDWREGS